MAEKNLRNNDRFSYASMASQVLNQKRSRRDPREPETTGEAISMRGKNIKLGDRARPSTKSNASKKNGGGTSQLDNLRRARDLAQQKLTRNGGNNPNDDVLGGSKRRKTKKKSSNASTTYMTTTSNSSSSSSSASSVATYRPRTTETRIAYEDLLAFVARLLPDGTSESLLHEFSEQALIILKSDDYINRREIELNELFNIKSISTDNYNALTALSRKMIDFDVNDIQDGGDSSLGSGNNGGGMDDVSVFLSRGDGMQDDEDSEDDDGGGGDDDHRMGYEIIEKEDSKIIFF